MDGEESEGGVEHGELQLLGKLMHKHSQQDIKYTTTVPQIGTKDTFCQICLVRVDEKWGKKKKLHWPDVWFTHCYRLNEQFIAAFIACCFVHRALLNKAWNCKSCTVCPLCVETRVERWIISLDKKTWRPISVLFISMDVPMTGSTVCIHGHSSHIPYHRMFS